MCRCILNIFHNTYTYAGLFAGPKPVSGYRILSKEFETDDDFGGKNTPWSEPFNFPIPILLNPIEFIARIIFICFQLNQYKHNLFASNEKKDFFSIVFVMIVYH